MEKTRQILMGLLMVSAVCLAQSPRPTRELMTLLQEAQYQEQTAGDLQKAIELYEQVLTEAADVEQLAARAAYQLGLCYQKQGDSVKAAEYFKKVTTQFAGQSALAEKAREQLAQFGPDGSDSVFAQLDGQVIRFMSETFGVTAAVANSKSLPVNSHVNFVDKDGFRYSGGMNAVFNWTGQSITQKVRLCSMTGSDYTFYDTAGQEIPVEFEPSGQHTNHYYVYWTPQQPLAPGESLYYGWSNNSKQKLPPLPGGGYLLTMQNQYGDPVLETFFLVLPKGVRISDSNPPTGRKNLQNYDVYWWSQEVRQGDNHIEAVSLQSLREASAEEIAKLVNDAVLTISTCAETDPRVKTSLDSLKGILEEPLVAATSSYLGEASPTVRRSAIYILWRGEFSDISAARQKLLDLCDHSENFTRGMAAIALGSNKVDEAYDAIVKMTLHDDDAYARRCAAYALGLLGDSKALPVLEQAMQDPEDFVKQNAQAAITMLTKTETTEKETPKPNPNLTQEGYNDIQPDGTIRFRSPMRTVNSGTEPIRERRFINSDFVNLTAITDAQGKPIDFTATHEGSIYRYHVRFEPPIMPGETFVYYSEGTISGLVKPVADQKDVYRYYMTHSPATGQPTLRIEHYLLPQGAEVLSTFPEDIQRGEKDGRIELRVEKVIPANGSITTSFTYRLAE